MAIKLYTTVASLIQKRFVFNSANVRHFKVCLLQDTLDLCRYLQVYIKKKYID